MCTSVLLQGKTRQRWRGRGVEVIIYYGCMASYRQTQIIMKPPGGRVLQEVHGIRRKDNVNTRSEEEEQVRVRRNNNKGFK